MVVTKNIVQIHVKLNVVLHLGMGKSSYISTGTERKHLVSISIKKPFRQRRKSSLSLFFKAAPSIDDTGKNKEPRTQITFNLRHCN